MIRRKSVRLMLLLVLGAGLLSAQTPPAANRPSPLTRRILILHDQNLSSPTMSLIDDKVQGSLRGSKYRIELYFEYFDVHLFPGEAEQKQIRDFLIRKYQDHRPDVIITVGSVPFQFMEEEHHRQFAGIPVVYCFPSVAESDLRPDPDFTGVTIGIDAAGTLRAALQMLPHTRRVFVITGTAAYDHTVIQVVKKQLQDFSSRVDIAYLTGLAMPDLLKRLSSLPKDSIVLFTTHSRDGAGTYFDYQENGSLIGSAANAPIFALFDVQIGYGQVGGDLVNTGAEGTVAGSDVLRILDGVSPRDIPVTKVPNGFIFDWRALQRWGLTHSDFPPGSIFLNRPPTPWELYKGYILGAFSLITLEALLILGLLLNRARALKAEAELHQNQRRLAGLVESALDAIIAVDEEQRIVLFNAAAEGIFGYPASGAIGSSLDRFVPKRFRAAHSEHIRRFGETGITNREMGALDTLFGVRSTGEEFPIEASISQVKISGKKLYTVIIRDITERKQAVEELQKEKAFTEAVIDSLPDIYFVIQPTGAFLHWGRNPERILGYSSDDTLAMSRAVEIVAEEDRALAARAIEEGFAGGSVTVEVRLLHRDGRKIPYLLRATRAHIGSEYLLVGVGLDITERKQAEAELSRLNRALQTIVGCRQRMAQAQDERAMLTDVCQVLVDLGGYRLAWVGFAENDEAKSVRPVVFAGHNEGYLETVKLTWADEERGNGPTGTAIRTGQPSVGWDVANDPRMAVWRDEALRRGFASSISLPLLQDGRAFGVLTLYSSRREAFDDNEIRLLTELANDVAYGIQALRTRADREQTARELEKSEARFRTIYEKSGMGIVLVDLTGRVLQSNHAFRRMMGYSENELCAMTFSDFTHPEDRELSLDLLSQFTEDQTQAGYEFEKRYIRKDGQIVWAQLTVTLVKDGKGQPQHTVAMIQDITERKEAVETLRRNEELFRAIIESTAIGCMLLNLKGQYLQSNLALQNILGYSADELSGKADREFTHPDNREWDRKIFRELSNGDRSNYEVEKRYIRKDGHEVWTRATMSLLKDEQGKPHYVVGMIQDISERKRAVESLRDSEAQLREAEHIAGIGSSVWDVDTDTTTWSQEQYQIFGWDPSQPGPKHADRSSIYTPESWKRMSAAVERALATGEPYDMEVQFVRRDGAIRWGQARGRAASDGAGRVVKLQGTLQEITEWKRAQEALIRLRQAVNASGEVVFMTDREGVITFVNQEFTHLYEYSQEEVIGRATRHILKDSDVSEEDYERVWQAAAATGSAQSEIVNMTKSGRKVIIERSTSAVRDDRGEIVGFISIQRDITARKRLEQQLMQAQKMEAVGQLAGGVAHDFNNILGIITGYADLTLEDPALAERPKERLTEIKNAADRAIGITRQLLAFSRKQVLETKILNLNAVVQETTRMLGRLLGEDIEVSVVLDPNLGSVNADPTGIDQIILNLAVNARDAMPNGGRLTITTANVTIEDDFSTRHGALAAGDYAVLTVADTGVGMDAETQEHIFEPFFTTKEKGRGTGLGLSTVFAIVNQSGGSIWTYSEVGRGTTFKIYLPRAAAAEPIVTSETPEVIHLGGETILLVEDDSGLRKLNAELLRNLGYNVIEAVDGAEALGVIGRYAGQLHLLLTDVIMPGMNGQQLAEEALRQRPTLKVLFVSGYASGAAGEKIRASGAPFLQKPLSRNVLAKTLREILDSTDTGAGKAAAARKDA